VTRHLDAETLARYRQEDLSRRRGSRVRAHLAWCERCRALDEELAGVTALLADVQPPPMPEHLAARIQTALAAEAARRVVLAVQATSTAPGGAAEGEAPQPRTESAGTAVPDRRTSRHGRHGRRQPWAFRLSSPAALRTMAAAAAAVVLAGGGYEIAAHVGGSRQPGPAVSGRAAGSAATNPHVAGPESGAAGTASPAPQLHYEYAGRQGSVTAVVTGTSFTPANLRSQVRNDLASGVAGTAPHARRSSASAAQEGATVGGIPVLTLEGCVSRIAAGHKVLLVEVAHYEGQSATVIVTAASADSPEQVWVAGMGCSRSSSDLLAHATLAPAG